MLVRIVALLVVAWLAACAFLFVWPREDEPQRADAVIVLAGGRKDRLAKGLELMRRNVSDTLVISDGEAPDWPAANRLCASGGDAFRVVCFVPDPYSTRGEAEGFARLAHERGWRSVAVVTSRFHVFRARRLFERCFDGRVDAVGAHYAWWRLPEAIVWENAKLGYALTFGRGC